MKSANMNLVKVLLEYAEDGKARKFLEELRWPEGPVCPHCESNRIMRFSDGKTLKCSKCRKRFTVTTGTSLHATKLPLSYWIATAVIVADKKKGLASTELARHLGVTQKTAWFMMQRIREMMKEHEPEELQSPIQVDETYVGGKNKNRHFSKKKEAGQNIQGRSMWGRTPVAGVLGSCGKVYSRPVKDVTGNSLIPFIAKKARRGATILTDEWRSYNKLPEAGFNRKAVEHGRGQYVSSDGATTNGMENYWSHLKRTLVGTYHFVSVKHLARYCAEQDFRHNMRHLTGWERAKSLFSRPGRHISFRAMTGMRNRFLI